MKAEFIKIFTENIHREGAEKLLDWLEKSDFFTAPASTKYHLSREGGLCEHSVGVYKRLLAMIDEEFGHDPEQYESMRESIAICALLHDICKTNYYKIDWKNQKIYSENGSKHDERGSFEWQSVPFYTVEDNLPYGHGEKSVYMISGFMRLMRDEAMAIRWHMGSTGGENAAPAFGKYPIAVKLHIADMQATFLDESEGK